MTQRIPVLIRRRPRIKPRSAVLKRTGASALNSGRDPEVESGRTIFASFGKQPPGL